MLSFFFVFYLNVGRKKYFASPVSVRSLFNQILLFLLITLLFVEVFERRQGDLLSQYYLHQFSIQF